MKRLEEIYEEILKSKDLQEEFLSLKNKEEVISFLKKNCCDATFDDLIKFLKTKTDKEGKVTEKELESLSSGGNDDDILSIAYLFVGCTFLVSLDLLRENTKGKMKVIKDSVFCSEMFIKHLL